MLGNMLRTVLFVAALLGATQIGITLAKVEQTLTSGNGNVALAAPLAPGGSGGSLSSGGCCGGGSASASGGGCGTSSGATNPAALKTAEDAAIAYYKSNGGTGNVTASATDYGCHIGVDILQNGSVVASYAYRGGQITPN